MVHPFRFMCFLMYNRQRYVKNNTEPARCVAGALEGTPKLDHYRLIIIFHVIVKSFTA